MASRAFFPVETRGLKRVRLSGSFAPAGTGAPTTVRGNGFSVARSGVGVYVITFDDVFFEMESAIFSVRVADATPTIVQGGDYDSSARTLQVRTLQESASDFAVADLAADADNVVSFAVTFRNTSVEAG